jgi:hypothetical protein
MPGVLVFDVNESMLDLRALDPHFERVFGDAAVRRQWFQQLMQNFLVTIVLSSLRRLRDHRARRPEHGWERLGKTLCSATVMWPLAAGPPVDPHRQTQWHRDRAHRD